MSQPPTKQDETRWFLEQVLPHEGSLRSYLRRALPRSSDIDDFVQNIYADLLRIRERAPIQSAKALVFSIARRDVIDFIRHRQRVVSEPITETELLYAFDEKQGVTESVCRKDELRLLEEAIASLPERCREVMVLRKLKAMPQREIAKLMGISENTVETMVNKGMHRIADYLEKRGIRL